MLLRLIKGFPLVFSSSTQELPVQISAIELQDRIITARDGLWFRFTEESPSLRASYLLILTESPPQHLKKTCERLRQLLGITPELIAIWQAQTMQALNNKKASET